LPRRSALATRGGGGRPLDRRHRLDAARTRITAIELDSRS
jgi:hypothetical protein